jgi:hypothetical protein
VKVQLPYYLVALAAGFVYAVVKNYFPDLPLTEEQVLWAIVAILTLLNVDVTQALHKAGTLR